LQLDKSREIKCTYVAFKGVHQGGRYGTAEVVYAEVKLLQIRKFVSILRDCTIKPIQLQSEDLEVGKAKHPFLYVSRYVISWY